MARAKTKEIKKKGKTTEETSEETLGEQTEDVESAETDIDEFPVKNKKDTIIALDEHVEVEIPEEKEEEDAPAKIDEEDDMLGEEIGLDDEELDPFGDKWEE